MRIRSFRPRVIAVPMVALSCGLIGAVAAPGAAQASSCGYALTDIKHGGVWANYNHGSDWEVIGQAPMTLSFNHSLAYQNTFSATVTLSAEVVSAALGYSLGKTETTQVGATFPVPNDSHKWVLQAGTLDHTDTFLVRDSCTREVVGSGSAIQRGAVTVKKFRLNLGTYDPEGHGARPGPHL